MRTGRRQTGVRLYEVRIMMKERLVRKALAISLALILASGTGMTVFADTAATDQQASKVKTVQAAGESAGQKTGIEGDQKTEAQAAQGENTGKTGSAEKADGAAGADASAGTQAGAAAENGAASGAAGNGASGAAGNDAAGAGAASGGADANAEANALLERAAAEDAAEKAAASKALQAAVEDQAAGDFIVSGDDADFSYADGVLTITGDVTVKTSEEAEVTSDRIVIAKNANVTLDGLQIAASGGPAVKVAPGVTGNLILKEGSENNLIGASGYAAVESGYIPGNLASVTIDGSGTLNAYAGSNSAAIGGSNNTYNESGALISSYHGNITIKGGTVNAYSNGSSGAAIGSGQNNRKNYLGETMLSASYKMETASPMDWGEIRIEGGTITARGNGGQSAGIGGGNHVDSGKIIISGGTIDATGYTGIGAGLGSSKHNSNEKGPGSYYADIVINGGDITARGSDTGAGIGGAMYSDAIVEINGGTIKAYGAGRSGYPYGGAGIGAGYLGHADVTINGGEVYADAGEASAAAGIGSGGTPNANDLRGTGGRGPEAALDQTTVNITGGNVTALGGGYGGAGIGGGTGADKVTVNISGGTVYAKGSESNEAEKRGGAGIGSGYFGIDPSAKYYVNTDTDVSITGGTVTAIGGWGASGIGSGADNKTAVSIIADAEAADIEAYSDGTKFAIDTRTIDDGNEDFDRIVTGDLMQGTFVFPYTSEDGVEQDTEGLKKIQLVNDETQEKTTLTHMPDGYRSFARTVPAAGKYSVYTEDSQIAGGEGRFFNKCTDDTRTDEDVRTGQDIVERNVKYNVTGSSLSDNFYLFPVKTIVVDKEVSAAEDIMDGIDTTLHFALWNDVKKEFVKNGSGEIWIETIEVVDGVPQGTAAFGGIDEGTYGIWEIDPDDPDADIIGSKIGDDITLVDVKTRHGDSEDNDATIDEDVWTDYVTVVNYYEGETDVIPDDDVPQTDPQDPKDSADDESDDSKVSGTKTQNPKDKADADSSSSSAGSGRTRTGDEMDLGLMLMILLAAACAMGIVVLAGRRKRHN